MAQAFAITFIGGMALSVALFMAGIFVAPGYTHVSAAPEQTCHVVTNSTNGGDADHGYTYHSDTVYTGRCVIGSGGE